MNTPPSSDPTRGDCFVTTRWTLVVAAGHTSSAASEQALADLCRMYWYPLYAYIRSRGRGREDAEDLTQSFLSGFLAGGSLHGLAAERGRFRAYLLASLKHFLANDWDRSRRKKRGGGIEHLSLDWQAADRRFVEEPSHHETPERVFDREWALALLSRVLERLRAECEAEGKGPVFEAIKGFLTGGDRDDSGSYSHAASRLGLAEGAVRVAVHRMRKRYRELLRTEIAHTLVDSKAVDEELRALRQSL